MKFRNEIKIGITVLMAVIIAALGFRFMSDVPLFRQSHEIVTTFEKVDGLSAGSVVYMNGVKIGSVRSIHLNPDYSVRVLLSIELSTVIPTGSVAYLTSSGLLDGKAIIIERGDSDIPVPFGGEITGIYVDSIMETLADSGEALGDEINSSFTQLNQFLSRLNSTIGDEESTSIGSSIENVETVTREMSLLIQSQRTELENAISSANRFMAQLDTLTTDNRPRVDSLMTKMELAIDGLSASSTQLEGALTRLDGILEKVDNGDGTLGRLVNDPSLYNNIDSLSTDLRILIQDLTENPGRYLRHIRLVEVF